MENYNNTGQPFSESEKLDINFLNPSKSNINNFFKSKKEDLLSPDLPYLLLDKISEIKESINTLELNLNIYLKEIKEIKEKIKEDIFVIQESFSEINEEIHDIKEEISELKNIIEVEMDEMKNTIQLKIMYDNER